MVPNSGYFYHQWKRHFSAYDCKRGLVGYWLFIGWLVRQAAFVIGCFSVHWKICTSLECICPCQLDHCQEYDVHVIVAHPTLLQKILPGQYWAACFQNLRPRCRDMKWGQQGQTSLCSVSEEKQGHLLQDSETYTLVLAVGNRI